MSSGVSVLGLSVRGVYVLGVSVQGVHVREGGGGVCPRTYFLTSKHGYNSYLFMNHV